MININQSISLEEAEILFSYMCSPGPGGQNVNKVATAVLLRFNVNLSATLSEPVKQRLLVIAANKINSKGELIIKASCHRSQALNKQDALNRLIQYVKQAAVKPKRRKKTKPSFGSIQKRLQKKKQRSKTKSLRQKCDLD